MPETVLRRTEESPLQVSMPKSYLTGLLPVNPIESLPHIPGTTSQPESGGGAGSACEQAPREVVLQAERPAPARSSGQRAGPQRGTAFPAVLLLEAVKSPGAEVHFCSKTNQLGFSRIQVFLGRQNSSLGIIRTGLSVSSLYRLPICHLINSPVVPQPSAPEMQCEHP